MKRKILSVVTLFAMLLSVFTCDGSFLMTRVAADNNDDDDDTTFVLRLVYNGTVIDNTQTGRNFNYFKSGGNIQFQAGTVTTNAAGVEVFTPDTAGVTVWYTHSNTTTYGAALKYNIFTNNGAGTVGGTAGQQTGGMDIGGIGQTSGGFGGVPLGVHQDITNRVVARHAGGVSPHNAGATGATQYTFGSNIAVPTRATGTSGNEAQGNRDVYVISAIAYRGTEMVRLTRSFILIPETDARVTDWRKNYGELMIFSLYSDSALLFDHDDGILFPGIMRENWIRDYQRLNAGTRLRGLRPGREGISVGDANPNGAGANHNNRTRPDFIDFGIMEVYGPTLPSNFNKRGRGDADSRDGRPNGGAEVPVYVEMFDAQGKLHISQSAGMRVKGGWSRGTNLYEQRTFEFYARNSYNNYYGGGKKDTFLFPLFEQQNTIDDREGIGGQLIHEYRRFRVRNGGSDRDRAYMRDEMANELFLQAGYPVPPQNYRPSVVFLNGAYYGFTFMKTPRTENHWDMMYGGREASFHMIGPAELGTDTCYSYGCGSVLPGLTQAQSSTVTSYVTVRNEGPMAASPYWGDRTSMSNVLIAGQAANTYVGYQPQYCTGSGNNTCAVRNPSNSEECEKFWSEPDDMCVSHQATRPCGKSANNCTGCAASCDWADIVALVLGVEMRNPDGTLRHASINPNVNGATATNLNLGSSARREALLNPIGLTNEARWQEFQNRVDADTLIQYYALGAYVGNVDWPANNVEMWRYWPRTDRTPNTNRERRGEISNEKLNANATALANFQRFGVASDPTMLTDGTHAHLDGKWRFIAQDGEMGWGIWTTGRGASNQATAAGWNSIESLITRSGRVDGAGHYGAGPNSFMMRALMGGAAVNNEGGNQGAISTTGTIQASNRVRFANALSDIMDGAFRKTNAEAVFDRIAWLKESEHRIASGSSYNATTYQYEPTPNRRISEIARPVMQLGNTVPTGWGDGTGAIWNVWPQWEWSTLADENKDQDQIIFELATVKQFVGDAAITQTTVNGMTMRRGGRLNTAGGMPAHINTTLGLSWANRTAVISVNIPASGYGAQGNGTIVMNTRPLGVENLRYSGDAVPDARADGRGTAATGRYWVGATIPIIAKPYAGYRVVWPSTVPNSAALNAAACCSNNDAENTVRITLTAGTTQVNPTFEFCPNFRNGDESRLMIDAVRAESFNSNNADRNDWIEISNKTDKVISTKGYFLTDGGNDEKFKLPSIIIRPGQRVYIPTNHNTRWGTGTGSEARPTGTNARAERRFTYQPEMPTFNFLKRSRTNFNLAFGERLRLNDSFGNEVARVNVSIMGAAQVQMRADNGNFMIWDVGTTAPSGQAIPGKGVIGAANPRSRSVKAFAPLPAKCPDCGLRIEPGGCECDPNSITVFNMKTHSGMSALTGSSTSSSGNVASLPFVVKNGSGADAGTGYPGMSVTANNDLISVINRGGRAQGVKFRLEGLQPIVAASTYTFTIKGRLLANTNGQGAVPEGTVVYIANTDSSVSSEPNALILGRAVTDEEGYFTVTATRLGSEITADITGTANATHATRGTVYGFGTISSSTWNYQITAMSVVRTAP